MSEALRRLNRRLKAYDRSLFAIKASNGMMQIYRRPDRIELCDYVPSYSSEAAIQAQFILALTDSWTLQGSPVEWGIEPVMKMLQSMDSWRDDTQLDQLKKNREQARENKERTLKNELRARAADMRRDFAKATNDINTSNLN